MLKFLLYVGLPLVLGLSYAFGTWWMIFRPDKKRAEVAQKIANGEKILDEVCDRLVSLSKEDMRKLLARDSFNRKRQPYEVYRLLQRAKRVNKRNPHKAWEIAHDGEYAAIFLQNEVRYIY